MPKIFHSCINHGNLLINGQFWCYNEACRYIKWRENCRLRGKITLHHLAGNETVLSNAEPPFSLVTKCVLTTCFGYERFISVSNVNKILFS